MKFKCSAIALSIRVAVDQKVPIAVFRIINSPNKNHWRGKSRREDIEAGLAFVSQSSLELEVWAKRPAALDPVEVVRAPQQTRYRYALSARANTELGHASNRLVCV